MRKYGFYYRYDTAEERVVLNRLWRLVNDRLNYLTPTKKATGFGTDRNGRRTRPGEEDLPLARPRDHGLVEEPGASVEVQPGHRHRDLLHACLERAQDVDVGVVAHGPGEHPPGVHAGQVHRAGELALQRRPAVRDGGALEESGLGFDLVTGLADLDRGAQRRDFVVVLPRSWSVAVVGFR